MPREARISRERRSPTLTLSPSTKRCLAPIPRKKEASTVYSWLAGMAPPPPPGPFSPAVEGVATAPPGALGRVLAAVCSGALPGRPVSSLQLIHPSIATVAASPRIHGHGLL